MDKARLMDVGYLDVSKTFDIVSHSYLLTKLVRDRLDEWTAKQIVNWLWCQA